MEVLPKELVRECLLRVPFESHDNLKAVCRGWEAVVSSPKFYEDRKVSGKSDHIICLILRERSWVYGNGFLVMVSDPVEGTWKRLSPNPIDDPQFDPLPAWCQCVAVSRKLVVIGGVQPTTTNPVNSVYIYDFQSARWSRGADMPTPRYFFACSVSSSTGLIYVAGGINEQRNCMADAEVYNVDEDKWEILPPMIQQRGKGCQSVFMGGKVMVLGGGEFERSAEVFDPSEGTWRVMEDTWRMLEDTWNFTGNLWETSVVVTSSGDLFVLFTIEIMKYDGNKNAWTAVATLPRHLDLQFVSCATQWRDCIFVGGFDFLTNEHVCYLFNPSTGHFNSVEVNGDGVDFIAVSAATVEI